MICYSQAVIFSAIMKSVHSEEGGVEVKVIKLKKIPKYSIFVIFRLPVSLQSRSQ